MTSRTIKVDSLARVEGEGAFYVRIKNGKVEEAKFSICEPPRFFEALLKGRKYSEAPDITARICGICPIAYQMSSAHAMENAFGATVDGQLRALRRLIYCGEWIESHTLHIYLLHAPDFMGYESAIHMAKDHPEVVKSGLRLKKIGNGLMTLLGGREIHPVNPRVGGFYKTPPRKELDAYAEELKYARELAYETVELVSTFSYPDLEHDYEYMALRHRDEYPFNEGRLVSNKGLDIDICEFENHFQESHVERSTALHCGIKKRGAYLAGPLARYNLNFDKLPSICKELAYKIGLGETCHNPFKSIIVRAIEVLFACEEALKIIQSYEEPASPFIKITPKAAAGFGCTEAPRGFCWHKYEINSDGIITRANIVPPTSQNQLTIENDLRHVVESNMELEDKKLKLRLEQAIRNHDPCISCATHFLKLDIDRE